MINFNRKPSARSKEEQQLEESMKQYRDKFGTPYKISIGIDNMTVDEMRADILRRIADNDPKQAPDYESGMDY